jgi:hypothetical protein
MKRLALSLLVLVVVLLLGPACRSGRAPETADTYATAARDFGDPPAEYRSAPLWVWNNRITEAEIDEQMADFKEKGIGGVFVHPRPGLITPYLSDEWLSRFRHAVDTGKSLGMKVWIYDENSYPSGFAGGHVPAAMPDAVRTGLRMVKLSALTASYEREPVVVLRKAAEGFEDITARVKSETFGPGEYYVFDLNPQKANPWYGGFTYVDLMRRDVTEKFLELTLEPYKKTFGEEFGKTVPGTFQDEAEISPAGGAGMVVVNWTPRLFEAFQARWGYDLRPHLPSLYEEVGDTARVRHDFYAILLDLFIEGWAKPYYEYAEKNGLALTGHYWEHEWPRPFVCPDNLAMAAWAHMPGIDILMNDLQLDTHGQFGNARAVKEIRSVANQLGRRRTMSETFGAAGWDLTFFDQKRIADWEYALGVNFMNQHLSYVTIMGARKRDHPQSFSYHEPWWSDYKALADHFGRLSLALSAGVQENRVLVLEPTTTGWMWAGRGRENSALTDLGRVFQAYVDALETAQVEYDLGSEATLKDHGLVKGRTLVVGKQAYDLVVLPEGMRNLESPTVRLLEELLGRGGRVLSYGNAPEYVDGRPDGRVKALAEKYAAGWTIVPAGSGPAKVHELAPPALAFAVDGGSADASKLLFHHRRRLADAELVFLANSDPKANAKGTFIATDARSAEEWDTLTGKILPYAAEAEGKKLTVRFDLPPGGSLLLCLKPKAGEKAVLVPGTTWTDIAAGPSAVRRLEPNVLTLDHCDLKAGGRAEKDLYFYDAQLKTYRAHGLDRNPWDSAVQYKTNILDKDVFPAGSGFEAAFYFEVGKGVDTATLKAVVERPALFQVLVNGKPLTAEAGSWWLDRNFGVFAIGPHVRPGRNTIVLKAAPFTIHSELEPVYLLGEFGVVPAAKGFKIEAASPLGLGGWKGQGLPFYGNKIAYRKMVSRGADDPAGTKYVVALENWLGSLAEVRVNGKQAGLIAFAPFRLDITDALPAGENEVEVVVCGTLKNTLGPFHNNPELGRAWPGSFQQGAKGGFPPGSEYSQVDYGLFADFKVLRSGK